VIKIFKKRYVIVTYYVPKYNIKKFYCSSWKYDDRKINFAQRFSLLEILKIIVDIHEAGWNVFRITRTGKLKKFI
jgi:hypothetical protein